MIYMSGCCEWLRERAKPGTEVGNLMHADCQLGTEATEVCFAREEAVTLAKKESTSRMPHQVKSSHVVGVVEATAWEGDIQVKAPAHPFTDVLYVPCARVEPIAPAQQVPDFVTSHCDEKKLASGIEACHVHRMQDATVCGSSNMPTCAGRCT